MGKKFLISFFILGLFSIISQVVLLREIISSFYGNEFFIGIVLASWSVWVAAGSGILGKILNRWKKLLSLLISLHLLVGICLALEIFLIRFSKTWIGFPGEIPNLVTAFLFAIFIPAPLCLILGLWWTIGTRIFSKREQKSEALAVNQAYFWEILGFIFGGILFSFVLIQLPVFSITLLLILLNLGVIFFLISSKKNYLFLKTSALFLFFILILLIFSPYLKNLEQVTAGFRFRNQNLLESINSPYGNISVTRIEGQVNFYESGLPLGSDQEIQFFEYLIHLSLLQHPSPQKILLIGGGFNGALIEILKHPVKEIYYLELDPQLIEIAQKYLSPEFKQALINPKVKIINTDAFYFLKQTEKKFDCIIVNLPDPSTALINRFYTQEFFRISQEKLNKNGIFTTYLTFSSTTAGKNLENLNVSVYKTLKQVFSQVIILPEDTNFFLASRTELTYDPESLIRRFQQREIKAQFLNEDYITYRLSNDRIEKTLNLFEKNREAQENQNFFPISYFYQTLFWIERFYLNFANFFKDFAFSFWQIFAGILIFLTLFLRQKRKNLSQIIPMFSIAIAGFSLMALEFIIIFAYQEIVGYLYFRIALLISALTAGMALGTFYGNAKIKDKKIGASILLRAHLLLIIFCAFLPFVFPWLLRVPQPALAEIVFLASCVLAGFLGGIIFPFSNKIYLSFQPAPHKKTGIIYAADSTGACLGALLPGLILIPVFGVFQSLIFVALTNFWIVLVLFFISHQ